MQQIINFLIRNKNFLLFLFLLLLSMVFTIQSHAYHKSKFISSTAYLSSGFYNWKYAIYQYFGLKEINERLYSENSQLRNRIAMLEDQLGNSLNTMDSLWCFAPFTYIPAQVYRNDYAKMNNYILINKGKKDHIKPDMGVITDKGIVGIVENSSERYSRIISILNSNSSINAGLHKSNHYGSLTWNGRDPNILQLETIPKQAILRVGDTIITHGRSTIFPKGIGIGTIIHYELDQSQNYYLVHVKLFNDMTNLGFVYAIALRDKSQIEKLNTP